jgi:hypothetical protein
MALQDGLLNSTTKSILCFIKNLKKLKSIQIFVLILYDRKSILFIQPLLKDILNNMVCKEDLSDIVIKTASKWQIGLQLF